MRGFTLVEILVVIAILMTLFAIGTPFFNSYNSQHILIRTNQEILETLRLAQTRSMTGFSNSQHGVHFEEEKFVLFKGVSYNPDADTNVELGISPKISISDISFSGSENAIFTKREGAGTEGSVTLSTSDGISYQISVTSVGVVNSERL